MRIDEQGEKGSQGTTWPKNYAIYMHICHRSLSLSVCGFASVPVQTGVAAVATVSCHHAKNSPPCV